MAGRAAAGAKFSGFCPGFARPRALQEQAAQYLAVLAWGLPPALLFRLYSTLNQSLGLPRLVTALQVGALLPKLGLSAWLALGGAGLPALGAVGCALATLIVNYALLAVALGLLRSSRLYAPYALWARLPAPEAETARDATYYLRHCITACEHGVERSHILPFAVDGALLLEIYVHDGIGTMVVDEKLESLREATADDVAGILRLIEPFEQDGTLVKRSRTEIERDIGNYSIVEHDGVIFACAALYPYPEAKTGEMAAVTVSPQSQGQGDGEKLLRRIEQRAREIGLGSIFVLTTRAMHWFIKRGFRQVPPDWLPEARIRKYNWDRKSQVLVKKL